MVEFLKGLDDQQRQQLKEELREHTVDLSSALGRRVPFDEVAAILKWGFEKAWGIEFSPQDGEAERLENEIERMSRAAGSRELD